MTSIPSHRYLQAVDLTSLGRFIGALARGVGLAPSGRRRPGGAGPVVMLIAFGPPQRRDRARCDLALVETTCLEYVAEVVGFVHRRGLPVDVWVVSGLSWLPLRAREIRRWLCALLDACPGLCLEIDTSDLSEVEATRLADALRRRRFAVSGLPERGGLLVGPLVTREPVP